MPVKSCHLEVQFQLKTSQGEWVQLMPQRNHSPSPAVNTTERKCSFRGGLEVPSPLSASGGETYYFGTQPLSIDQTSALGPLYKNTLLLHPLPLGTHCPCPLRQPAPASTWDCARGHFQTEGGCTEMPASECSGSTSPARKDGSRWTKTHLPYLGNGRTGRRSLLLTL